MWTLIALLVAVSIFQTATSVNAQVRPGRGPLIGYIHANECYASTDANPADFGCTLFAGDLAGSRTPRSYPYVSFKEFTFPHRWRIAFDHFWSRSLEIEDTDSLRRIPLRDLEMLAIPEKEKWQAEFAKRYPWDPKLTHYGLHTRPISQLARDIRHKTNPLDATRLVTEAYFDFLPTAPTKMTLFILYEKKIQLLEGEFTKREKPDDYGEWWDYKWAEKRSDLATANFHAPFILYEVGKTSYFLTQFGECHGLKDDGKGGRTTELLWGKDDQPIARLITDTATGKTFAFTLPLERKDGAKAKPGYFELSAKPELVEYDPAKMKKNDFEYPYKQIRECVDVLLADKKIDPNLHKPREKK